MRYQKYFFQILIILTLSTSVACTSLTSMKHGCSDNWKVTGYYTPVEDDYLGSRQKVTVQNTGMVAFRKDFIRQVRIEGWGKTRYGWYLGYYRRSWHKSANPLNSKGKILKKGMVAVDSRIVPLSTKIRIPGLYSLLGQETFTASDVGTSVKRKHVDVYTGEGVRAKQLAYKITGQNIVCL